MNHSPAFQMKVSTSAELSPQCAVSRVTLLKGRQEPERRPETAWQTFSRPAPEERKVRLLATYCKKVYAKKKDPIILNYLQNFSSLR